VLLGRLFDTVGRKPMISGCYALSGVLLAVMAVLFNSGSLTTGTQVLSFVVIFFFASAGASAAYLTVSEIFPMETRAMAIAFFYAVGTGLGGAIGPVLYGTLIDKAHPEKMMVGFLIAAGLMLFGGAMQALFGVAAEQKPLEEVAEPILAEDGAGEPSSTQRERKPLPRYRHAMATWSPYQMTHLSVADDPLQAQEMQRIAEAVRSGGRMHWRQIAQRAGARHWGPGRFRRALHSAADAGMIVQRQRGWFEAAPMRGELPDPAEAR
jgi:MFS family permease